MESYEIKTTRACVLARKMGISLEDAKKMKKNILDEKPISHKDLLKEDDLPVKKTFKPKNVEVEVNVKKIELIEIEEESDNGES